MKRKLTRGVSWGTWSDLEVYGLTHDDLQYGDLRCHWPCSSLLSRYVLEILMVKLVALLWGYC